MTSPLEQARTDLSAFANLVGPTTIGHALTEAQARALVLDRRHVVLVTPRQTGKTDALSLLGVHFAFAHPRSRVLVISAGEEAARRLLGRVRALVSHPLLAGSIVDEASSLVVLSNGAELRSVPASERQVRGWSVDLLLVDEASLVSDDLLLSAAIPTTAARPDARIVLASTPWATSGGFYDLAMRGSDGGTAHVITRRWSLSDAPWLTPSVLAAAREALGEIRYRAEYEAEFVGRVDAYFDPSEILGAVADYRLFPAETGRGESVVLGVDWSGRSFDLHAVVAVGVLDDYGANAESILFVPWLEAAQRPYAAQIERIARLVGGPKERYHVAAIVSETNGVGASPSETLVERLGHRTRVVGVHSSQRSKEDSFGRARSYLSRRRLALPNHVELLRQLRGLRFEATSGGGLSIEAANPGVHDDLADALALAMSAITPNLAAGHPSPEPREAEWIRTGSGIRLTKHPRPRPHALGATYGQAWSW